MDKTIEEEHNLVMQRRKSLYGLIILWVMITCFITAVLCIFLFSYQNYQTSKKERLFEYELISKVMGEKIGPIKDDRNNLNIELRPYMLIPIINTIWVFDTEGQLSLKMTKEQQNFNHQQIENKIESGLNANLNSNENNSNNITKKDISLSNKDNNISNVESISFAHIPKPTAFIDRLVYPLKDKSNTNLGVLVIDFERFQAFKDVVKHLLNISLVMILLSLFISLCLSIKIKKIIFEPMNDLSKTIRKITRYYDYSIRAKKNSFDEIGELVDGFNLMVEKIQNHEQRLLTENHNRQKMQEALLEKEKLSSQIAEQIKKTSSNISDIINAMPSVVIGVGDDFKIKAFNYAAVKFTGMSVDDVINKSVNHTLGLLDNCQKQIESAIRFGQVSNIEKYQYYNKGKHYYLDIMIYPLNFDGKNGAVIRIDDISHQVKLEEKVHQSEKMMSIKGLAAGMSHEINNPMAGILQSLQNIERRLKSDVPANIEAAKHLNLEVENVRAYLENRGILKFLQAIKEQGERAASIVQHMLIFSRNDEPQAVNTDIHLLIERVIDIVKHDKNEAKGYDFTQIQWVRDYDKSLNFIQCLPSELEEGLIQVFKNAAQAVYPKPNEKIVIKTHHNEKHFIIDIQDYGVGIADEIKPHIFEPFFTTREVGKGIGLGLSILYFIISVRHQGEIKVESHIGVGTHVRIYLPK